MTPFLIGLAIILLLTPLGVWTVRLAKRQRGGAGRC